MVLRLAGTYIYIFSALLAFRRILRVVVVSILFYFLSIRDDNDYP